MVNRNNRARDDGIMPDLKPRDRTGRQMEASCCEFFSRIAHARKVCLFRLI